MFRLLLIAALAVLTPGASMAQMPGCQIAFHAVTSDGAPEVEPAPQSREHTLGVLALALPTNIAPGAEWTLEIRLEPRRVGVFVGDIDIWAGGRFLTRVAQLQVR